MDSDGDDETSNGVVESEESDVTDSVDETEPVVDEESSVVEISDEDVVDCIDSVVKLIIGVVVETAIMVHVLNGIVVVKTGVVLHAGDLVTPGIAVGVGGNVKGSRPPPPPPPPPGNNVPRVPGDIVVTVVTGGAQSSYGAGLPSIGRVVSTPGAFDGNVKSSVV